MDTQVYLLSHFNCVLLFVNLWTVAHQTSLSMQFSRQEYWSGAIIPFSRGSSLPRGRTQVSWIAGRFFRVWAIRKIVRRPHANEPLIGGSFDSKGALGGLKKSTVHLSQSCSFWGGYKFSDSHHCPTRRQTSVPWISYLCQSIRRIHTSPDLPNIETKKATEIQMPLKQIETEYYGLEEREKYRRVDII